MYPRNNDVKVASSRGLYIWVRRTSQGAEKGHYNFRLGHRETSCHEKKKTIGISHGPEHRPRPEVSLVPGSPPDPHSGLMLVGRRISADDTAVAAVRLPSFEPEFFFFFTALFCGLRGTCSCQFGRIDLIYAVSVNAALPKLLGIEATRLQFHPAAPPTYSTYASAVSVDKTPHVISLDARPRCCFRPPCTLASIVAKMLN